MLTHVHEQECLKEHMCHLVQRAETPKVQCTDRCTDSQGRSDPYVLTKATQQTLKPDGK